MKLYSANLSTVFAQSDDLGLCAVSCGGTPLYKIRKNFVPPRDMASKPMLVWRWPPGRPRVLVGELMSLGVSCRAKRSRLTVFLSGPRFSAVPGVFRVCMPSCPCFPELKCQVGEGNGLSYF